jgi:transcriptional regulator with XRE-family HTH domain
MPADSPSAGCSDLVGLGRALRELRHRQGLQQEAVGFDAGFGQKYVGAVERGRVNPSFLMLVVMTRTMGVTLAELVAGYDRILAVIDPHAGADVPRCPTPGALAHLRKISADNAAYLERAEARRARSRMRSWT